MSKLLILVLAVAGVSCDGEEDFRDTELFKDELEEIDLEVEPITDQEPTLPFVRTDGRVDKLMNDLRVLKKNLWGNVDAKCPSPYTWNSRLHLCYMIHKGDEVSWHVASLICRLETEGGRLVVFKSDSQRIAVTSDIQASDGNNKFNYFVGARRGRENKFWWTDGSSTDRMTWCEDQPSGTGCGNLWGRMGHCMDDTGCRLPQRFICEKPVD